MEQKVSLEEVAMLLGQKEIEIMLLQKQVSVLQKRLREMEERAVLAS